MYEQYYRFAEKPFGLTHDPKFVFASDSHVEGLQQLRQVIDRRECFAAVTGDVGTGKTTLCRALVDGVDKHTFVALLRTPPVVDEDLLIEVLREFGVASVAIDRLDEEHRPGEEALRQTLHDFLASLLPLGAKTVLVVDEAQGLPVETLEQIGALSNLTVRTEPLLQVVLVAQLGFEAVLGLAELRQLDRRLSLRCRLRPLSAGETGAYIAHRLALASGGPASVNFTPAAVQAVHQYSKGIPRVINLVCHRALLAGQSAQAMTIDADLVTGAAEALDLKEGSEPPRRTWFERFRRARS